VLLALAIFLMSLVAIARLVDMGTDRELEGRLQTRGTRLVQAKMAEFESGVTPFTTTDGSFDGDDSVWSWSMTDEVQMQGPPALHLVTVTVSRDLKGRPYTITLSQLMLDPTQTGGAAEATRPDPSGGTP
jgi:general secretion pathway protein I